MQTIKFAIVGTGHIGKRHAEMISRSDYAELCALCDIESSINLDLKKFDVPFFQSLDELLESDIDFDVLCVATPNGMHAEHAIKGLEKQKHIVIEKPMALSKAECERIIFKSMQEHKHVFCVMQNRYSPPSIWIKDIMDKNLLGDIYMVQIDCYWNRGDSYYDKANWKGTKELDGGTLFTQFSHFVDIMYWLFGDITDIQAKFNDFTHNHNTDFEDSGFVNFKFLDGGMGCINYSTAVWNKNFESSLTVLAEKGTVKIGGQYMNKVEYCHIENYEMPELPEANPANDYGTYKGSAANHNFIFENVVQTLNKKNRATTNALEGLKVVEIIERIYEHNSFMKKVGKTIKSLNS